MSLMIEDVETGAQMWGPPDVDLASGWCTLEGFPRWSSREGRTVRTNERVRIAREGFATEVLIPVEVGHHAMAVQDTLVPLTRAISTWRFRWDGKSVDAWGCPLLRRQESL